MHYEEHRPAPSLARHVQCYWFLAGAGAGAGAGAVAGAAGRAPLQPIVPDGRMELILNLSDRFLRHGCDASVERQAATLLAGQITRRVVVEPSGAVDLVGVRFRSDGAAALLRLPLGELRDQIVEPAVVPSPLGRDLPDRLHEAPDRTARVQILDRHLMRLRVATAEPDRLVAAAVAHLRRSNGRLPVRAVTSALGTTERTLERRFQAAVGIGPKLFARIARFQHAFHQLGQCDSGDWTGVAYRAGYYDQAHLIRDFRAFAGTSPSRFFAGQTTLADFFSRDGAEEGASDP